MTQEEIKKENEITKKLLSVVKTIKEDCEFDAKLLDSMPFNGKTLGTIAGQNLAMISCLANMLGQTLEQIKTIRNAQ